MRTGKHLYASYVGLLNDQFLSSMPGSRKPFISTAFLWLGSYTVLNHKSTDSPFADQWSY